MVKHNLIWGLQVSWLTLKREKDLWNATLILLKICYWISLVLKIKYKYTVIMCGGIVWVRVIFKCHIYLSKTEGNLWLWMSWAVRFSFKQEPFLKTLEVIQATKWAHDEKCSGLLWFLLGLILRSRIASPRFSQLLKVNGNENTLLLLKK